MSALPVTMLPTIETDVYFGAQAHERPQLLSACPSQCICPWSAQFSASVFNQRNRVKRYIDSDPLAAQLFRRFDRRSAAAKWVQHDIARVRRHRDNAFKKRNRFLCWVSKRLFASGLRNVCPAICYRAPFGTLQIFFILWDRSRLQLHHKAAFIGLPHTVFRPTPNAGHPQKFIGQIGTFIIRIQKRQ